jgi:hypothetical protein
MPAAHSPAEPGELGHFAAEIAAHAGAFLLGVNETSSGSSPDTVVPELLVQLAQVSMAGAMLGAVTDVLVAERFEPDAGPDPDADPLRLALAQLLTGVDDYAAIFDPLLPEEPFASRISDDVADIAIDLSYGLRHYEAGRADEALWWWQYSFLSHWGAQALSAQRALLSIVSHQRLDADADVAGEAQLEALLGGEVAGE